MLRFTLAWRDTSGVFAIEPTLIEQVDSPRRPPLAALVAMEILGVYFQQDLGVLELHKSYASANLFEINFDLA